MRTSPKRPTKTTNNYVAEYPMGCGFGRPVAPLGEIFREDGELHVVIDDPENFNLSEDDETYAMASVIRASEDDPEQLEPDFDGISRIANEWVFIEH